MAFGMRFMRCLRQTQPLSRSVRAVHAGGSKSRNDVLARWNAVAPIVTAPSKDTAASSSASGTSQGKGMNFASEFFKVGAGSSRLAAANSTVADVKWDLCERMDYYVQYAVPASWRITEAVRENSVSIQCSPPPTTTVAADGKAVASPQPTVHGISINCFAYKQRVAEPDSGKLLHIFLRRFNASVGNSLQVLSEHASCKQGLDAQPLGSTDMGSGNISEMLANRLNSAVAEITFTAGPGQPLAHGLCRAFFNSNARFHYVTVVAVPEDEYGESQDLIINAIASVIESRVEAAAKRT